jgi:hypothetical protein
MIPIRKIRLSSVALHSKIKSKDIKNPERWCSGLI